MHLTIRVQLNDNQHKAWDSCAGEYAVQVLVKGDVVRIDHRSLFMSSLIIECCEFCLFSVSHLKLFGL